MNACNSGSMSILAGLFKGTFKALCSLRQNLVCRRGQSPRFG
jgi:hypothetical protein